MNRRIGRTAASVRQEELFCGRCKAWKVDSWFPKNANERYSYRRFRGGTCNTCMGEIRALPPKKYPTQRELVARVKRKLDPGPL